MNSTTPDTGALRRRLGAEIDRALLTSDELGASLIACYLQMARDILDPGPNSDHDGCIDPRSPGLEYSGGDA
ncbi:MAG: hypothetical protein WDN24_03605 [Sphingomonas sp.]